MTTYVISTVSNFTPVGGMAMDDILVVAPSGVWKDTALSFLGPSLHFSIAGYAILPNLSVTGAGSSIDILQGGSFNSNQSNVTALSVGNGVPLTNSGQIMAADKAVRCASGSSITNDGTIFAQNTAVTLNGGDSTNCVLVNSGLITSRGLAAVQNVGDHAEITNSGRIEAIGAVCAGVICGISDRIDNSGSIYGKTVGIQANLAATLSVTLTNEGSISGSQYAYEGGDSVDTITNHGTFSGAISLGGGADRFDMTDGRIAAIDLGTGADVFIAYHSTTTGDVAGGDGADSYYTDDANLTIIEAAGSGLDTVHARTTFALAANVENLIQTGTADFRGFGNEMANTITGNLGDNRLLGFAAADTITGGAGDDSLLGGAGNDTVTGGDGDDLLEGNAGNDTLRGDEGADRLIGGLGKEYLVGGADADMFVFATLTHSAATQANADVIADFKAGEDHIDLAAIDAVRINQTSDDAFKYIGAAGFSGVSGQLRYAITAGVTYIQLDVNGDSVADSMIKLSTAVALNAADFVL